jgi:glutamyl-tRNA synthetase
MINSAPVVELSEDDAAYAEAAAESLAAIDGDELWGPLVADLKSRTGRKGRALFQPLRLALTGQQHGPEMAGILALIGKDEALRRLRAAAGQ